MRYGRLVMTCFAALPGAVSAGTSSYSVMPAKVQMTTPAGTAQRISLAQPVGSSDATNPIKALLPQWHPKDLGDRVKISMEQDGIGARLRLAVRF